MSRNKNSGDTIQLILDTSLNLFLEKGYEETTVLDIVDGMGGLTRGAFYHHFKSKEEVVSAISTKLFVDDNPFKQVREHTELNGLEKVKWVLNNSNKNIINEKIELDLTKLLNSPTLLKKLVDDNKIILAPLFEELIAEGKNDGSIEVNSPKIVSELFVLLINFWTIPILFPCSQEEQNEKLGMIMEILAGVGLDLRDGNIEETMKKQVESMK
ncbi:MAG: TetR/AcrR family transcriptional regulator [Tissierellia bacterium]|nr:TetR/AcrR family transcriptional regulator [Tissierellia bacterium]